MKLFYFTFNLLFSVAAYATQPATASAAKVAASNTPLKKATCKGSVSVDGAPRLVSKQELDKQNRYITEFIFKEEKPNIHFTHLQKSRKQFEEFRTTLENKLLSLKKALKETDKELNDQISQQLKNIYRMKLRHGIFRFINDQEIAAHRSNGTKTKIHTSIPENSRSVKFLENSFLEARFDQSTRELGWADEETFTLRYPTDYVQHWGIPKEMEKGFNHRNVNFLKEYGRIDKTKPLNIVGLNRIIVKINDWDHASIQFRSQPEVGIIYFDEWDISDITDCGITLIPRSQAAKYSRISGYCRYVPRLLLGTPTTHSKPSFQFGLENEPYESPAHRSKKQVTFASYTDLTENKQKHEKDQSGYTSSSSSSSSSSAQSNSSASSSSSNNNSSFAAAQTAAYPSSRSFSSSAVAATSSAVFLPSAVFTANDDFAAKGMPYWDEIGSNKYNPYQWTQVITEYEELADGIQTYKVEDCRHVESTYSFLSVERKRQWYEVYDENKKCLICISRLTHSVDERNPYHLIFKPC